MATRRWSKMARREAIEAYLYLSPWLIGLVMLTAGPLLAGLLLGFTDWQGIESPRWIGAANFVEMFTRDKLFRQSLQVTLLYSLGNLPLAGIISLALAVLLNQNVRGISFMRTIYYLPAVVSGVAVAILWQFVFHRDFGVINWILQTFFHLREPINWLGSERWALPAFILMGLWGVGGSMIIVLAGLQGVPVELHEAATIDGAGAWPRFWNVTVPMLSPTLFFNLITGIIGTLNIFTSAYIMTKGGPNFATYFYALNIYFTAFRYLRLGYASALAFVMFLLILGLTLTVFSTGRYWVYYAGEREEAK